MQISADLLEQIVEHARRDWPNECCGFIATREGRAVAVHPAANVAPAPKLAFEVEPRELLRLTQGIEDAGCDIGAIYHSHTRSPAFPSQTDVNFAANWPGVEWLIVGVANGGPPEVRSFLIDSGEIAEVEVSRE